MANAQQVIDALVQACRGAETYRELPGGLRRTHLHVLYAIEQLGGAARVTDIAEKALVKVPNMTRLLKETDSAGWTTKGSDPADGRTVLVLLTDEGAACLQEYYWDYLNAIAEGLRAHEHPEYDVMIDAIGQAVDIIERVTGAIDSGVTHQHPVGSDGVGG